MKKLWIHRVTTSSVSLLMHLTSECHDTHKVALLWFELDGDSHTLEVFATELVTKVQSSDHPILTALLSLDLRAQALSFYVALLYNHMQQVIGEQLNENIVQRRRKSVLHSCTFMADA